MTDGCVFFFERISSAAYVLRLKITVVSGDI